MNTGSVFDMIHCADLEIYSRNPTRSTRSTRTDVQVLEYSYLEHAQDECTVQVQLRAGGGCSGACRAGLGCVGAAMALLCPAAGHVCEVQRDARRRGRRGRRSERF